VVAQRSLIQVTPLRALEAFAMLRSDTAEAMEEMRPFLVGKLDIGSAA
jgi:hypothetical protein